METHDTAYLRVLTGSAKGRVYVLRQLSVFDLGRGDYCQVELDDDTCAFNHARIYRKQEGWTFFDLNSERGSSINDIPVEKRDLAGGEIIKIGTTEMQFTFEAPQAGSEPASADSASADSASVDEGEAAPGPLSPDLDSLLNLAFRDQSSPNEHSELPEPSPEPQVVLPLEQATDHSEEAVAVPAPTPTASTLLYLVVVDGGEGDFGRRLLLEGSGRAVIGRAPESDFVLKDAKVSRHHCVVEWTPESIWITDLSSANGTVVNTKSIQKVQLQAGDHVRFGYTIAAIQAVPATEDVKA